MFPTAKCCLLVFGRIAGQIQVMGKEQGCGHAIWIRVAHRVILDDSTQAAHQLLLILLIEFQAQADHLYFLRSKSFNFLRKVSTSIGAASGMRVPQDCLVLR